MDLKDKRVLVVGLGKSGAASALFCRERGARVTISDAKAEPYLSAEIPHLLDAGVVVETGMHGERTFRDQDLIVVSPGVPSDLAQLQQARALGVPVIGEVELAYRFIKGKVVAITGSNGKTTTTTLVGEILKHSGRKVQVGGNIGTPGISLVAASTPDTWNVLEISSFQLETIQQFHPHVAAILNITPDHLDRHHTFEAYVAAKARVFENQNAGDFTVLNADDAATIALLPKVPAHKLTFSRRQQFDNGLFVGDDQITWRRGKEELTIVPVSEIPLKGAHNVENVLAAVGCAMVAGCPPDKIREAVRAFKAVEHRLEFVARLDGVEYFNDSKATNVDATIKALESFPGNIHIILGGKDKGSDYTVLRPLLQARVKRVYTIGAAAAKIESQIKGAAEIVSAETLDNAIRRAAATAAPGDTVLLAPACASFDQFQSYEHRGRVFKEVVQSLAARRAQKVAPDAQGGAA